MRRNWSDIKPVSRNRARELRRNQTAAEQKIWRHLRDKKLGVKFRRQVPIGPYIVDLAASRKHLAIEIDGDTHAIGNAPDRDQKRTEYLESLGWRVIRYTNNDVLHNLDSVFADISKHLGSDK